MNQGKLEVVKQEIARVNIDILGISELKWMGMGQFNSDDHYIYYCGQQFLTRNGVALIVNKRVWNAILWCSLKNDRMISVHFQGKPFSITVMQVYAPTTNAKQTEVQWFYDLQDFVEHTKKRCPFHHSGLECKNRKARDTWRNRQVWPWSTKWIWTKANRALPREHTSLSKHHFPTTQEMTLHMDITRWSTPKSDWLCSLQPKMEKFYTDNKNKTRSWLWLRSWTPYYQIQTQIEESRGNR